MIKQITWKGKISTVLKWIHQPFFSSLKCQDLKVYPFWDPVVPQVVKWCLRLTLVLSKSFSTLSSLLLRSLLFLYMLLALALFVYQKSLTIATATALGQETFSFHMVWFSFSEGISNPQLSEDARLSCVPAHRAFPGCKLVVGRSTHNLFSIFICCKGMEIKYTKLVLNHIVIHKLVLWMQTHWITALSRFHWHLMCFPSFPPPIVNPSMQKFINSQASCSSKVANHVYCQRLGSPPQQTGILVCSCPSCKHLYTLLGLGPKSLPIPYLHAPPEPTWWWTL